jgi:cytoskeletal protein CcmA (bactofilin family)
MAETGDTTVVGADSHFKGELSFEKTAKIIGKFDGKITGKGELLVSQNAQCKADVDAAGVQVDGLIEGNLNAKDTVKLNGSGVVRGDITAAKMVMTEGASFHGMCAVGPDSGRPASAAPAQSGGQAGGSSGGSPGGSSGQPPKK